MQATTTNILKRLFAFATAAVLSLSLAFAAGCTGTQKDPSTDNNQQQQQQQETDQTPIETPSTNTGGSDTSQTPTQQASVSEDGTYTSKDEVALYIHLYGHLPSNFISKTKARNAGWVSSEGNLDEVCPGMSIGGSRFYNDEGALPEAKGRTWTECDIDYHGGYRNEKRIVFSNDGLIFYTGDHYETFEQLY